MTGRCRRPANKIPAAVRDQAFRQIVRISLGGSRLRFVFSNAFGDTPLKIGAASVARPGRNGAASVDAVHRITFGGEDGIVVRPSAPAVSDPVDMNVSDATQLTVSTWLPNETPLKTFHWHGRETGWFTSGDLRGSATFPTENTTDARVLLREVLIRRLGELGRRRRAACPDGQSKEGTSATNL